MREHTVSRTLYASHLWTGLSTFVATAVIVLFAFQGGHGPTAAILGILLVLAAIVAVLLSAYFGYTGTRGVRARLAALADASALFAAGRLGHRIALSGSDDIALVASQLNVMAQRLQDQVKSLQEIGQENLDLRRRVEMAATLRERERVRRELHDRVSQDLFGLSMLCRTALAMRDSDPAGALDLLPELAGLAKRTQGAMRALLLELRPAELAQRRLGEAIRQLAEELSARTEVRIDFSLQDTRPGETGAGLPAHVEDSLFLVAQEALINALKHGRPTRILVALGIERERVVLRIRDDGGGLGEGEHTVTSMGMRSMVERAEVLGGTCVIRDHEGGGVEVLAIIPLVNETQRGAASKGEAGLAGEREDERP